MSVQINELVQQMDWQSITHLFGTILLMYDWHTPIGKHVTVHCTNHWHCTNPLALYIVQPNILALYNLWTGTLQQMDRHITNTVQTHGLALKY